MNKEFNSQEEIWEWLIKKNIVVSKLVREVKYKLIDGKVYKTTISNPKFIKYSDNSFFNYTNFKKETSWYDNIPEQGILCKCWNDIPESYDIQRVFNNNKNHTYPFKTKYNAFLNAIPLTHEDLSIYLYSEKDYE